MEMGFVGAIIFIYGREIRWAYPTKTKVAFFHVSEFGRIVGTRKGDTGT